MTIYQNAETANQHESGDWPFSERGQRVPAPSGSPQESVEDARLQAGSRNVLKGRGKYVLQMDNPYLLLNRYSFESAGVNEEEAENTAKEMVQENLQ